MPVGKENNKPLSFTGLEIENSNLIMTSSTISKDPGWLLLNVVEMDGKDTELIIKDMSGKSCQFQFVNAIEEPISSLDSSGIFKAFENRFIKVKIE
jgi:hypothetical protein